MFRYTKYLDVKDPVKASQFETGYDLFIPEFDDKFKEFFYKFNKHLNHKNHKFDGNKLIIYNNHKFAIPSGITIDYQPSLYGEICNRSSNWKHDILVQNDICDNSYTGDGHVTQCIITNPNIMIVLKSGERISQLVIKRNIDKNQGESPAYYDPQFVDYDMFQTLHTVKEKRKHRDGGFGSSGK